MFLEIQFNVILKDWNALVFALIAINLIARQ